MRDHGMRLTKMELAVHVRVREGSEELALVLVLGGELLVALEGHSIGDVLGEMDFVDLLFD